MWSVILICEKVDEDILPLAIGNDHLYARLLHTGGSGVFGMHTATAKCALLSLDIFAEVATRGHKGNNLRLRVVGLTGEDTVDIAQQDEHVGMHHLGNKSAEFVIISEHKFGDANSVVLVDDWYYIVFEHHCHTSLLVFILLSRVEVFLHSQNLSDVQMMLAEKVVV